MRNLLSGRLPHWHNSLKACGRLYSMKISLLQSVPAQSIFVDSLRVERCCEYLIRGVTYSTDSIQSSPIWLFISNTGNTYRTCLLHNFSGYNIIITSSVRFKLISISFPDHSLADDLTYLWTHSWVHDLSGGFKHPFSSSLRSSFKRESTYIRIRF